MQSFNPRTHTGCDVRQIGKEVFNVVSIHAPTRGATQIMHRDIHGSTMFQSTHPHGVRLEGLRDIVESCQFQSTHPHGVRRLLIKKEIS